MRARGAARPREEGGASGALRGIRLCLPRGRPLNAAMSRHATPILFLDFETTGGVAAHDRIIEAGLIRVERGTSSEWETLVNPERPVPEIVRSLTGLRDADLAEAPVFADVAGRLADFVRGATVVAHNAPFEREFLKAEFARLGLTPPPADYLCTRRIACALYPELPKHSMDVVASHVGLRLCGHRHRALPDAKLARDLWDHWLATLPRRAFESAIGAAFV